MLSQNAEQGTALLGAVLVSLILSMLGMVSMNLAAHEFREIGEAEEEAVAGHLAEAGVEVVQSWLLEPSAIQADSPGTILARRYDTDSGASFFDAMGKSQFSGTADRPDLAYDASQPADDRLLNDPANGWFRSLRSLGRILKLKVYGPIRPRLLCTVEVTAGVKDVTRTVSVQLGARTIPPIRAGVQIGNNSVTQSEAVPLPVALHWGDMRVKGNVFLGQRDSIPAKTQLAPVTGQSYKESSQRLDRWLDLFVGGDALFSPSAGGTSEVAPSNVYVRQDPVPGLHEDSWDYESMKKYAMLYGSYYARDQAGLLYRNGVIRPGAGLTPDEVFGSAFVGDHRGLVFIDTLDGLPPRPDNLGTVTLKAEYAEGLFIVNANLQWNPTGIGQSIPVLSPPDEGVSALGARVPVELSHVQFQGVLSTPGDLTFQGQPRMFGALMVGGKVEMTQPQSEVLEVWYNHELGSGIFRGLPVIYAARGTWQEVY